MDVATAAATAKTLVTRSADADQPALDALLQQAANGGVLTALFQAVIDAGLYDLMLALLGRNRAPDGTPQRLLAGARPDYGRTQLNAGTVDLIRNGTQYPTSYDLLVVPGFTPVDVKQPLALADVPVARQRVELAAADLKSGRGRYVFVSGGSVHPPGTPYNEALMMRDYLLQLGVAPNRILVDPHARHSTTNLRNAGRAMLSLGLKTALIVTGFDGTAVSSQTFYFAHDILSTFQLRCRRELGYTVGDLTGVGDDNHVAYTPSSDVTRPLWSDPLDV